ncbi:Gfo/Idh/MocA family oxidoreductase [Patescibacteria group bacterium]|nr:Gfo/Idh/MocA family oxidoreductase [Patescibacteria group bacterium]MBU0846452.1 Gfo/Idh/MocA family oxidoreductase [Patescibacteria group bacterium]
MKIDIVGVGYWGLNYKKLLSSYDIKLNLIDPPKGMFNTNLTSPDAAVITTPASTHFKIAKEYLKKGIDVLVEKPLALSSAECEELIDIAKEHESILMVGHTYLYNPAIRYIKEHTDINNNIYFILANRTSLGPVRRDVDCIWDLAPHDISIINYILDAEPVEGHVTKGYYLSREICDIAFITLMYPGNVLCNITVGWLNANKVRRLEFVSEKERIVFDDIDPLEKVKIYHKGAEIIDDKISMRDGEIISPNIRYDEPLKLQINDFFNSIKTRQEPLSDGLTGLRVTNAIENLKVN